MTDSGIIEIARQVPVFGNLTGSITLGEVKAGKRNAAGKPPVETKPLK